MRAEAGCAPPPMCALFRQARSPGLPPRPRRRPLPTPAPQHRGASCQVQGSPAGHSGQPRPQHRGAANRCALMRARSLTAARRAPCDCDAAGQRHATGRGLQLGGPGRLVAGGRLPEAAARPQGIGGGAAGEGEGCALGSSLEARPLNPPPPHRCLTPLLPTRPLACPPARPPACLLTRPPARLPCLHPPPPTQWAQAHHPHYPYVAAFGDASELEVLRSEAAAAAGCKLTEREEWVPPPPDEEPETAADYE
jgi:hypothetical protein